MRLDLGRSLEEARAAALSEIGVAADEQRLRHVPGGPGRVIESMASEAEARAYRDAGYPVPLDADAWPLIEDERDARGGTARQAADRILLAGRRLRRALAAISTADRRARQRIVVAATHAEIRAALLVTWPTP